MAAVLCVIPGCGSSRSAAPSSTTSTTASSTTTTTATSTTVAPATTAVPATTTSTSRPESELQETIEKFVARQPVPFSVVAVDLRTGERAEHLASRQVLSASLYKLFVARELLRRISAGQLSRDAPAGDSKGRTVGACLEAMIVVSDNDCGQAGLQMVGGGALDAGLARDGYVSTRLASPQRTSAADVATFLQRARARTLLGPGGEAASAELYGLLRRQQVNDRIPKGLPPGTPIAHKTADRLHWAHDAGIITTPSGGEYLLAVLTGSWALPCCDADHPGPAEARAFGAIADLAKEVHAILGH